MEGAYDFLTALTVVLCVAAVTTILFHRLRQSVVLGYLLAGLIVGPFLPIPLVADPKIIHALSELGVILLMFSLGLEFTFRKLVKLAPTAGLTALIETSLMGWLGFVAGRAFGWSVRESVFLAAIVAISSTTIVAKAFADQSIRGRVRELVVGILIAEDLIAIAMMATLTAFSHGRGLSAADLLSTTGRLAAFLIALIALGMVIVPRLVRAVVRMQRPEVTLVSAVGLCFGIALLAQEVGYSVALGAFIAGALVAESGVEHEVELLVRPLRDMFAAVFFVSVGMMIDPAALLTHAPAIAVLVLLVVCGKVLGVSVGAFLTGNGTRVAVQSGMSLGQIGEFSFIIASLALTASPSLGFLYPIAVAVSAITALLTPLLIRGAGPAANWVDRKLPRSLQTFAALYGSWVANAREARLAPGGFRRMIQLVLLDALVIVAIVIGASVEMPHLISLVNRAVALSEQWTKLLVVAAGLLLASPFVVGILRNGRRLGVQLAERAFPTVSGKPDLAQAPRRALAVSVQLFVFLVIGAPIVAVTQPFLSGFQGVLAWALLLVIVGVAFWRSAAHLQGHVRAGAQVIVEALANQAKVRHFGDAPPLDLEQVNALLPGLGEPVTITLDERSPSVGKSLAELNLRGATGATVLAIQRGNVGLGVPGANERLQAGDVLALAGTREAIKAAKELLSGDHLPR